MAALRNGRMLEEGKQTDQPSVRHAAESLVVQPGVRGISSTIPAMMSTGEI